MCIRDRPYPFAIRFSFWCPNLSRALLLKLFNILDFMRKPLSVPGISTALAQHWSFDIVSPSPFNDLSHFLRANLLSEFSSSSARSLKTFLFPRASALRALLNRGAL